jgi:hypothetical protein
VQCGEHLAQIGVHSGTWQYIAGPGKTPLFQQWIFFDDLWAAAHPALANGILRFAQRWDVLS